MVLTRAATTTPTPPSLFSGNGQLIRPSDLTLGGCPALHAANRILHFQTTLQGCGSTLTVRGLLSASGAIQSARRRRYSLFMLFLLQMTEDSLVYSFSLTYSPTPVGDTAVFKTNAAGVVIECHYRR